MVTLLVVNCGLCVWVTWCFKEQKFPVVWPVKVLRLFGAAFLQAFDIASLNILQVGLDCRFNGPKVPNLHFDLFPRYSCLKPPHVLHAIVSAMALVLFVVFALFSIMAQVEVNLLTKRPSALGHSGPEVMAFGIKVVLTLVRVLVGYARVEAVFYLGLTLTLAWQYLRWNPHLVNWVNCLKGGVSVAMVWCSVALVLLVFHPGVKQQDMTKWADSMTLTLLSGLVPAFLLGAIASWHMIRYMTNTALTALATAKPDAPLKEICQNIESPKDVEVIARCCRVWEDRYNLDATAVNKARQVIQAGLAMFPNSAYMVLLHGNFMIDVLGVSQSGSRRIEDARKLDPNLMCRFMMFVRHQQASVGIFGRLP
ncbi:hypothetical protein PLESTM_001179200 [Pleodorina starrii]|nr:hypothetical protein PLESTM_001179200 [Pleodorina starrii]